MDENKGTTPTGSVENSDVIFPIGWDENTDIFDESTWKTDATKPDGEEGATDNTGDSADNGTEETVDSSANGEKQGESVESGADADERLATPEKSDEQPTSRIQKVKTTIDHKEKEIDVDLDKDLPELLQKAHGLDRVRDKLNGLTPMVEKTEMITALLGYDSIDAMLDAAKNSYMEAEEEKLIGENVHPEVAKDMVRRKVKEIEDKVVKTRKAAEEKAEEKAEAKEEPKSKGKTADRDFRPEVATLLQAFPEIRGKTIPNEVLTDSLSTGKSLTQAYSEYKARQAQAELDSLRKENKTLKQNADAARRAPIKGASATGVTETNQDDPFLKGFNSF